MPIFNFTLKKIMRSPSTWIVLFVNLFILSALYAITASIQTNDVHNNYYAQDTSMYLINWYYLSSTIVLGLTIFTFVALKVNQVFRDDINDGTLLILVSKPLTRSRIWFEKWLSLQVVLIVGITLTIFLSTLVYLIPQVAGVEVYKLILARVGLLMGIAILFQLLISSIALLLSLYLNNVGLVATLIVFALVYILLSDVIERIFSTPQEVYQIDSVVTNLKKIKQKAKPEQYSWFKDKLLVPLNQKEDDIGKITTDSTEALGQIYSSYIIPEEGSINIFPLREQEILKDIFEDQIEKYPDLIKDQPDEEKKKERIELFKNIYTLSEVIRLTPNQSYIYLFLGVRQLSALPSIMNESMNLQSIETTDKSVSFPILPLATAATRGISNDYYEFIKARMNQKTILRRVNIFYHLRYLWTGLMSASFDMENLNFIQTLDDPAIYQLKSFKNATGGDVWYIDLDRLDGYKILDFKTLLIMYIVLGGVVLGASWFAFKKRDFT